LPKVVGFLFKLFNLIQAFRQSPMKEDLVCQCQAFPGGIYNLPSCIPNSGEVPGCNCEAKIGKMCCNIFIVFKRTTYHVWSGFRFLQIKNLLLQAGKTSGLGVGSGMQYFGIMDQGGGECPTANPAGGESLHCFPCYWPEIKKEILKKKRSGCWRILAINRDVEDIQIRVLPEIIPGT